MKNKIKIRAGWRKLRVGETIREGDEWFRRSEPDHCVPAFGAIRGRLKVKSGHCVRGYGRGIIFIRPAPPRKGK